MDNTFSFISPSVIEIQTPGPQGRKGDTPDTSGLLEKNIFYDFTSSYNTGSFSGSYVGFFKGELDPSVLATSSSHALESISSSFASISSQSLNALSASYVPFTESSSYAENSISSSYSLRSISSSYSENSLSSSYSLKSISSSYADESRLSISSSYSLSSSYSIKSDYLGDKQVGELATTSSIDYIRNIFVDNKSYVGFINNNDINVSYDYNTRKITLSSAGGIYYYWKGVKHTLGNLWESPSHDTAVGIWYLYSNDGENFIWSLDEWDFDELMISRVYYTGNPNDTFGLREVHGTMDFESHRILHNNIGTYRESGGFLTLGTYTEDSPSNNDVRPGFDSAYIRDEDLTTIIPQWLEGSYTNMYIGINYSSSFTKDYESPFMTGSYIKLNNPISGTLTDGINDRYYNIYQIIMPVTSDSNSQKFRMIMLQPQREYQTFNSSQAEELDSLYLGNLSKYSSEYVIFSRITYYTNAVYSNKGKCKIPIGGIKYFSGNRKSLNPNTPINYEDHSILYNLKWNNSGHNGTSHSLAAFDINGNPVEKTILQATGSSEIDLMSQKSITYYLENIQIDGGNAFTVYN